MTKARVIDALAAEVEQARDLFYATPGETMDQVERLEQWQQLADRLFTFQTMEGLSPVYRGPEPRWRRSPR